MKKFVLPFLALSLPAEEGEQDLRAAAGHECGRCRGRAPGEIWLRYVQANWKIFHSCIGSG